MKAEIDGNGVLSVLPEDELEAFALVAWNDRFTREVVFEDGDEEEKETLTDFALSSLDEPMIMVSPGKLMICRLN